MRVRRLKKSEALAVNYGLKNDGSERISARLRGQKFKMTISISIAKTNSPKNVETGADFAKVLSPSLENSDTHHQFDWQRTSMLYFLYG